MHHARLEAESTLAASLFSHVRPSLNQLTSPLVLQRQQCDCRRLNMSAERHPINDAVSRIPTSVNARTIEKHLDVKVDSLLRRLGAIADCDLLDGDDAESSRDHPAPSSVAPRPAMA